MLVIVLMMCEFVFDSFSTRRKTRIQDEIQTAKPPVEPHNDEDMNDIMSQYLDQPKPGIVACSLA